jgi:hypothetical protein
MFISIYRSLIALVSFGAVSAGAAVLHDNNSFRPLVYVSFFTIITNLFVVGAMVYSSHLRFAGRRGSGYDAIRVASTSLIAVTMVMFVLLLARSSEKTEISFVLHYVIPIATILDLFFDRPQRSAFKRAFFLVPGFVVAYLGYLVVLEKIFAIEIYPLVSLRALGGVKFMGLTVGVVALSAAIVAVFRLTAKSERV